MYNSFKIRVLFFAYVLLLTSYLHFIGDNLKHFIKRIMDLALGVTWESAVKGLSDYTLQEGEAYKILEVLEIKIHNLHLFEIQVIINFARVSNISYICARMLVAGAS